MDCSCKSSTEARGETLKAEILQLKKDKNAVILAHYYVDGALQDIADYVGDSLALAQKAAAECADADIVVMCGVNFMADTVKVLCPGKKVLVPDNTAGCSLADSCPADDFEAFIKAHPGHIVISYVNTSVDVKALSDVLVTSGNARKIVDSMPADARRSFGPDRNLGSYINSVTGRDMVLWDGACHVHERFSVDKIAELKRLHPDAPVLVHPECKRPVVLMADKVGSTAVLLDYALKSDAREFIVATESGILHKMRQGAPDKTFIPVPPADSTCGCNDCAYMKLNTLEKLRDCLRDEAPEIHVDPELAERALRPIERMLELSAR
ncbi:MAG: quinolinate synthase NadA [Muribaculaceae bacterium]|nr:quinolinate synthase NadA [Muribaculaceae bacterium]